MAGRRGFNSRKNRKNNQWSRSLFSLSVVSSRYNIERHNFPREVSLNVVNYWLPGFHRPVYTGRRRKSPRGRRLGGRENRCGGGGHWGGKLVSIIVIKSAKEKSRENHKQTNEKGRGRGGLKLQGEKRVGENWKTSTKFATWRSVLVKQFDYDSWIWLSLRSKFF